MKLPTSVVGQLRPFSQGNKLRAKVLQIPILGGNKTPQPPHPPAQETKMSALNGMSVNSQAKSLRPVLLPDPLLMILKSAKSSDNPSPSSQISRRRGFIVMDTAGRVPRILGIMQWQAFSQKNFWTSRHRKEMTSALQD